MEQIIFSQFSLTEFKTVISEIVEEKIPPLLNGVKKDEGELLSRKQVAKILKISLPTLNSFTKKEIIKGHRVGRRVLYKYSDIETSLKEISSLKYKSNSSRK